MGSAAVGIIAALVFINNKLKTLIGAFHVVVGKLNKIEQISNATMQASEGFLDALQQSAEGMMFGPQNRSPNGANDDFQDLRETFEEGIRNLEDDPESDEEDKDTWKKGT